MVPNGTEEEAPDMKLKLETETTIDQNVGTGILSDLEINPRSGAGVGHSSFPLIYTHYSIIASTKMLPVIWYPTGPPGPLN